MTLNGALQVGRSALMASQAALRVAGDNMANAATEGFHRRSVQLSPVRGEIVGRTQYIGRGVELLSVRREIDTALQARYRDAISDEQGSLIDQRFLNAVESIQGELTDNDLSSLLSDFFNSFSELANSPSDSAVRAVVVQQGQSIASRISDLNAQYSAVVGEIDRTLGNTVQAANDLLDQIALIDEQITLSETGAGQANALRDQRDLLIDRLAEYVDVTVLERDSGSVDILVNSTPVLLAGESRGFEFRKRSVDGELEVSVRVADDGTDLQIDSGTLGALLRQRDSDTVVPAVETLGNFAEQLIFQVNRLHSQGQGQRGYESLAGTYGVNDTTTTLNSVDTNLPFRIENGSFFVHMTHQDTGQRTAYRIDVDGDVQSLDDLVNEINTVVGVPNLTAGIDAERKFTLTAAAGYEVSFSDDTSEALAALGVHTFFDGRGASTISVNQALLDDSTLLAAGAGHIEGTNDTAISIANLQDKGLDELGGVSMRSYWQNSVSALGVKAGAANAAVQSSSLVRDNLFSQIQAVSGVSLDEEAINLLTYQRQFQAAARFITVIDESLQILISLA